MKPNGKTIGAAVIGALLMAAGVKASDPVGVYAIVERVVFEPSETAPRNVQIWGAFTAAVQPETRSYKPEEAYGPVGRGYLYYTCAPAQLSSCTAEWNDLNSVAGKTEVVGFGTRWGSQKPRLRLVTETPASPDPYLMNVGVVKVGKYAEYPSLVAALKAAIGRK
jgi:hypothetical protein